MLCRNSPHSVDGRPARRHAGRNLSRALCHGCRSSDRGSSGIHKENAEDTRPRNQIGAEACKGDSIMAKLNDLHRKWMKPKEYRQAHEALAPEYALAGQLFRRASPPGSLRSNWRNAGILRNRPSRRARDCESPSSRGTIQPADHQGPRQIIPNLVYLRDGFSRSKGISWVQSLCLNT
jgi:hypothetical protein